MISVLWQKSAFALTLYAVVRRVQRGDCEAAMAASDCTWPVRVAVCTARSAHVTVQHLNCDTKAADVRLANVSRTSTEYATMPSGVDIRSALTRAEVSTWPAVHSPQTDSYAHYKSHRTGTIKGGHCTTATPTLATHSTAIHYHGPTLPASESDLSGHPPNTLSRTANRLSHPPPPTPSSTMPRPLLIAVLLLSSLLLLQHTSAQLLTSSVSSSSTPPSSSPAAVLSSSSSAAALSSGRYDVSSEPSLSLPAWALAVLAIGGLAVFLATLKLASCFYWMTEKQRAEREEGLKERRSGGVAPMAAVPTTTAAAPTSRGHALPTVAVTATAVRMERAKKPGPVAHISITQQERESREGDDATELSRWDSQTSDERFTHAVTAHEQETAADEGVYDSGEVIIIVSGESE